jgi:hypothetical protein
MGFKKGHKDIVPAKARKEQGKKLSMLLKNCIGRAKGKHWKMSEKGKINIGNAQRGKKRSIEFREKQREIHSGSRSHFWKGGITPERERIRKGIEYRLWREAVLARDNWTCQKYGIRGGKLCAHHIIS